MRTISLLLLIPLSCWGQRYNSATTGTRDDSALTWPAPQSVYSGRPGSPITKQVWIMTDTDCAGTASATPTQCRWSGSAWQPTGGSGGGGGGSPLVTPVAVSSGDTSTTISYGTTLGSGATALPSCVITSSGAETQAWSAITKTTTTMTITWSPAAGFTGFCTAVLGGAAGPTGSPGAAGSGSTITITNDGSTGTTTNLLAKLTTSGTAVTIGTGDTAIPVFVCSSGCGTTSSATLTGTGTATCQADGSGVTRGHFVQASTAIAGRCKDAGTTAPTSGWVIGVAATSGVANATFTLIMATGYNASAGGAVTTQAVVSNTLETVYQNTGSTPKFVSIGLTHNGTPAEATVICDAVSTPTTIILDTYQATGLVNKQAFFIVLPGYYYKVHVVVAPVTVNVWTEWQ